MIPRLAACLAMVLLLVTSRAYAQTSSPSGDVVRPRLLIGAQFGAPTKVQAGGGVFFEMGGHDYATGVGPLVGASAGTGGFRVAGGVAALEKEGPGLDSGLDLQLVLTRTSSDPRHASPQATYAGAEGGLVITSIRFSLGFAHRVGGSAADLRNILTWSVGVQIPIGSW